MKKQKIIIIFSILVIILLLGIGYASFSSINLKINPTATATASSFNVCFDTVEPEKNFKPITSGREIVVDAPTPTEGATTANLKFEGLKEVGDTASATFVVKNMGDIAADSISAVLTAPGVSKEDTEIETQDGLCHYTVEVIMTGGIITKLKPNATAKVKVSVELLNAVSEETENSCTVKIIAEPVPTTL